MKGSTKGIGAFSISVLAVGSLLFAPSASAYIQPDEIKPSAPSREQEQIQLQLAEKTRDLAEQYTNRLFGTDENPVIEDPVPVPEPVVEKDARQEQRERFTNSDSSSSDVQTFVPPVASVQSEPVAQNLPKLPSSGFGLSAVAIALGITGAIRGRKKLI